MILLIVICMFVICPILITCCMVYIENRRDFSINSKMIIAFITGGLYCFLLSSCITDISNRILNNTQDSKESIEPNGPIEYPILELGDVISEDVI